MNNGLLSLLASLQVSLICTARKPRSIEQTGNTIPKGDSKRSCIRLAPPWFPLDRSTEYVRSTTTRDVYGNVTSNDWGEVLTTISPDPDKTATTNGPRTRQTTTISYSNNNPTSVDSPLVSATAYTWNDTYDAMTSYTDELGNKVYQVIDSATGLVTQRRWEQKASTANWQNASLTVDVNGDTFVSPIDALAIVNYVNSNGEAPAAASSAAPPYLDVDGNGLVTNADADYVIAYINVVNSGGTPYAPPTASTSADTIQQVDITYVTTSGLPKGLVATETVQTGRTSGTRVTTYQYINTPSDPARHARVSSITETGDSVNAVTSFTYDNRGNISSVTDPAGRVTKFWHDNRDRLIATMSPDPDGTGSLLPVLTRYDYDSHDNLIASELINSRVEGTKLYVTALITSYTYDAMGRQTSTVTQRPDLEWHLTYSSSTVGLTSTKPSSTSPITTSILEAYAAANSRIVNTPASNSSYRGLVSEVSYFGTANTITETISNNGSDSRVFKTEYDLLNRPVKSVTPAPGSGYTSKTGEQLESGGIVSRVEYDNLGNVVASRDGLNNLTKFTYDDLNRVTSIGTPHPTTSGSTLDTAIEYFESAKGWITKSNDPLGIKTFAESDMLGRTVRVSGSGVSTQSVSYWKDGLLKSTTDGFGQVTDYAYDRQGRLTSVTAPAATSGGTRPVSNWTYAVDSLLSTAVDPLSRTTTYQYDAGGRIQSVVSPDPDGTGSLVSAYSKVLRDSVGNVMASTDAVNEPLGNWNLFTYDSWFRNTSSIDALGAVTSTNFDVFGNVTSVVDPLNNTTSYTYNKLQQLVTENKGTDRSFSYDANGNLATLTDRNSRVTTYTYDNRNRLTNESWGGTRTLGYTYDSIDRLTAISDSDSLALDFSFAYDSRSQLQGEVQSGSSYLLGKSFAFDRDYDNVGNQTKLASIIGGALSGTDITGGIKDFANTYTYDYLNRRTSATQSQASGGNSVAAKHVTTAFNLASQITDVRRYSDTTNSSANLEAHTRHSFDSAGRLKSITHSKTELGAGVNWDGTSSLPSTGTFAAYFLSYDADNRITSLASRADGFVTNFTYDIIDQLTAATTSAISGLSMPFSPTAESYNLDENGNRKSSGGASQSASGTHNRLQTDGTYNYTYDNEGNVTRRTKISDNTVTDYTWDYRNRLATVTDKVSASGATLKQVEYTYDAFDQRTAKRVDIDGNGTWDRYEVYTWADGQEVQRWVDSDGAGTGQKLRLANRYLWAESVDQLLSDEQYASGTGMEVDATTASGTAGTTLWALTDHLGSVRDLLDNNGVVREHNVFDSFGRLIREVDYNSSGTAISSTDAAAVDSIFGYTGRNWDSDIGMQYNRARWYDPQTGRWLSQDPIGFAAGDANLYRYVGNKPTMATDPTGLQEPTALPTPEEMERIRRELGRNRAMGGIALGAHGHGVPAGSFARNDGVFRGGIDPDALARRLSAMATSAEGKSEGDRVGRAIANTFNQNSGWWRFPKIPLFGPDERSKRIFCYEWAWAFHDAFMHESSGDHFKAKVQSSITDDLKVHYWLKITSADGKTEVYVDDGFWETDEKTGVRIYIHDAKPMGGAYKFDSGGPISEKSRDKVWAPPFYDHRNFKRGVDPNCGDWEGLNHLSP
ncbi:RHS repeat-associated core domain-containing protein [Pirellulaceae bacterium SH467]